MGTLADIATDLGTGGLSGLFKSGLDIINKIIPDPAAKAAAQLELMKLEQSGQLAQMQAQMELAKGQLEVDKIEAASPSLFKSGWRPYIGWTCGVAISVQFVIGPIATWVASLMGHPLQFPPLDMMTLMGLVGTLLGTATLRSFDKKNGVG